MPSKSAHLEVRPPKIIFFGSPGGLPSGGEILCPQKRGKVGFPCPLNSRFASANCRSRFLDPSGSTITDSDFVSFNNDWNAPLTSRIFQHLLKVFGVFPCVAVVNFVTLFGVVLTGRLSVRSAGFAINDHDFLSHRTYLLALKVFAPA